LKKYFIYFLVFFSNFIQQTKKSSFRTKNCFLAYITY